MAVHSKGNSPDASRDGGLPARLPRVLLVSKTRVTERSNAGAQLGKWFARWPQTYLAQIYSGGARDLPTLSGQEYQLAGRDRRAGWLFGALKATPLGDAARSIAPTGQSGHTRPRGLGARLRRSLSNALLELGVWELAFAPRLSEDLTDWARTFGPDIIFTVPQDLTFMRLALQLHKRLRIPVALFASDDFQERLYKRSPFRPLLRPIMRSAFRQLAEHACCRFSTGPLMTAEYRRRYGLDFEPLMMCDEGARFREIEPIRVAPGDVLSVLYSGALGQGRWRSLLDVNSAAELLAGEGIVIRLDVFTSHLEPKIERELSRCHHVTVHGPVSNAQVPQVFRGADVLLLAEGFDQSSLENIRLSLSTKSHLYMMSQRPTLVYGPAGAGVVEYARQEGWALVVDTPGPRPLALALRRLHKDGALQAALLERSRRCAARHEAGTVQDHLRHLLVAAASAGKKARTRGSGWPADV